MDQDVSEFYVMDYNLHRDEMAIIEKYDRVFNYLYPIFQSIPQKHGILKKMAIECMFRFPERVYDAAKSNQSTKIFLADSSLASLRYYLRKINGVKGITLHQEQTALIFISEVGRMMGSWINKRSSKKG